MTSTQPSTRRITPARLATALALTGMLCGSVTVVQAAPSWWPDNVTLNGYVRAETAIATTNHGNDANQYGNAFDRESVPRTTGGLLSQVLQGPPSNLSPGVADTTAAAMEAPYQRVVRYQAPDFNYHVLRATLFGDWRIANGLKLRGRLNGVFDPGNYSEFKWDSMAAMPGCGNAATPANCQLPTSALPGGGRTGGDPALYGGSPNLYQYRVSDGNGSYDHHPQPLEWATPRGQVYFSSLFLEYTFNGATFRLGQQQIAWGNAIFFRVFDTANGLDLRRHSVFDYAQEEYEDKRVPAPAFRFLWQAANHLNVDAYVEKFQPSILGNPETPYNPVPDEFTVYDHYKDYETRLNTGIRLRTEFDQLSFEAMYGRRYNPWGAFRWTATNVNQDFGGVAGSGPAVAQIPFSNNPTGINSAQEWFHGAGNFRFDGQGAFNRAMSEFPATAGLGATASADPALIYSQLNAFSILGNGVRGYIAREYFREDNIGVGMGYVTDTGATNSFWNQIVLHLEVRYTPNRTLTSPDLRQAFFRTNDWVSALTIEKYYRFLDEFPSTYMVLQYMHRTRSDMFGRALAGYGARDYNAVDPVNGTLANGGLEPQRDFRPHGISGANYVVFAAQQPFPNKIWQVALATLFDVHGGLLAQPAVQWTPDSHWQATMFYNYVNGHLWGNPNNNLFGKTSEYANEVALRLQYQF